MSHTVETPSPAVPPEEVARRIAEYRRLGYQHRAPAMMVYLPPHQECPWAGCGTRIAGVRFDLDRMGNETQQEQWMASWWQGPGLVGRCPGCGHYVLFGYEVKQAVSDLSAYQHAVLPDDWNEKAALSPESPKRG